MNEGSPKASDAAVGLVRKRASGKRETAGGDRWPRSTRKFSSAARGAGIAAAKILRVALGGLTASLVLFGLGVAEAAATPSGPLPCMETNELPSGCVGPKEPVGGPGCVNIKFCTEIRGSRDDGAGPQDLLPEDHSGLDDWTAYCGGFESFRHSPWDVCKSTAPSVVPESVEDVPEGTHEVKRKPRPGSADDDSTYDSSTCRAWQTANRVLCKTAGGLICVAIASRSPKFGAICAVAVDESCNQEYRDEACTQ